MTGDSRGTAGNGASPGADLLQAVIGLYQAGRLDAAEAQARQLTERFPRHPFGWKALGALLREQGRSADAVRPLSVAAALARDAESVNNLGLVLQDTGDLLQAEAAFREALQRAPALAEAHVNLGRLCHATGRLGEALASLQAAIRLQPDLAEAHQNLAAVYQDSSRPGDAEAACRRALAIDPGCAEAHVCLGAILNGTGRLAAAEACFRRALELRPDNLEAHSNLLFNHCYRGELSAAACLEEARQYGRKAGERAARGRYASWSVPASPQRLRVGLVSGDLRQHPVGYFLDALLAEIDGSRLEVVAYPTHHGADALTQRLRSRCADWRPIQGLGDAAAAALIHGDGIQVLFDLAGHTANNRLPVFAYRPAPVQASWLGYFATTGVAEIDYLLADAVSVPAAHHEHFTETIWYLPETRLCFTPPQDAPEVSPLPALRQGRVTFGNFQNLAKLNDAVLALWARVLAAVPQSRLRLQNKQLADAAIREQLGQRLQAAGIAAERVSLHGLAPRAEYLAAHGEVDLILDTFPFPGGTTTCEALWMGVPTLTLAGDRLIGLQGASLLAAAGLKDWIAVTPEEYVAKALACSRDLAALAGLRAGLRARVLASPLFDAPRFARHFETAVWAMWQRRQQAAG